MLKKSRYTEKERRQWLMQEALQGKEQQEKL